MNKSLATNLIAISLIIAGYFSPIYAEHLRVTGFFALSGALTNWLAIHLLFEKVPFLYGSGVIPNRFDAFRNAIKNMIINEFFHEDHVKKFLAKGGAFSGVAEQINYDQIFNGLIEAISASSLGGMLGMIGGAEALEPLREPVKEKIAKVVADISSGESSGVNIAGNLQSKIEEMVDARLAELTPEHVKEIVQKMIRQHLGWLVVWGGVFGGLIGLVVSFFG